MPTSSPPRSEARGLRCRRRPILGDKPRANVTTLQHMFTSSPPVTLRTHPHPPSPPCRLLGRTRAARWPWAPSTPATSLPPWKPPNAYTAPHPTPNAPRHPTPYFQHPTPYFQHPTPKNFLRRFAAPLQGRFPLGLGPLGPPPVAGGGRLRTARLRFTA